VLLFDSGDGRPLAIFDADGLTALRTAAMSMVATRALARPDPQVITICGAGEQADWHLRASLACFPQAQLRIWARRPETAQSLRDRHTADRGRIEISADLHAALRGADVIHTTTAAKTPFLPGAWLEPGQHVNLVGASLADAREIDDDAVARMSMFTDSAESSSRESGEILGAKRSGAVGPDHAVTEIGRILSGAAPGRSDPAQITAYKSHGLIVQDLVAAHTVFRLR
jgi:ornithine cyclodeaminase